MLPTTNTEMSVDFKPFTPANYFKTMQILGIAPEYSDKPLDLSELGEGARNFILLSLLRSFAENFKFSGNEIHGLLALEEPELFLHPQARRHLWNILRKIASSGMQVIISTHSDSFIDTEYFDEIGRVIRIEDTENQGKKCTELITCSKQKIIKHCELTGVPKGKATLENISEYYTTTSNMKLNEGFFSRLLILVEGETEELAIPELVKEFDIDCDALGISIIPVNGKNQIPKYWRLYSQFNIPIIVIFDNDNCPEKENSNKNIATCFGLTIKDFIENVSICKKIESVTLPKTSIIIIEKDFETAFSCDLLKGSIEGYNSYREEAKAVIKPIGNQQKGVIARFVIKKIIKNYPEFNSELGYMIASLIADKLE
jgi:putative ATP-dependent endonuclease of the OLD family